VTDGARVFDATSIIEVHYRGCTRRNRANFVINFHIDRYVLHKGWDIFFTLSRPVARFYRYDNVGCQVEFFEVEARLTSAFMQLDTNDNKIINIILYEYETHTHACAN